MASTDSTHSACSALVELAGPAVRLRPIAELDWPLYRTLYTDPEILDRVGPALSLDQARRQFDRLRRDGESPRPRYPLWTIRPAAAPAPVGLIGLAIADEQAELGVLLLRSARNAGIASAAIRLLVGHAFTAFALRRLHTSHHADHGAAAGLMRRVGFQPLPDAGSDAVSDAETSDGIEKRRWHLLADTGQTIDPRP